MWFYLALASAILGAVDVILNKQCLHKVSAAILTWSLFALTIPILTLLSLKEGVPNLNPTFFIGAIGSSLTYVFAKTITNETLKQNLISKVFPLTAFSGIFTYIFGLTILSESIRLVPVLGLLSVILGSYILSRSSQRRHLKAFQIIVYEKRVINFFICNHARKSHCNF